jgi:hypothetical protein
LHLPITFRAHFAASLPVRTVSAFAELVVDCWSRDEDLVMKVADRTSGLCSTP